MQLLLDTVDIEKIKEFNEFLPITGITSNPAIVKEIAPTDFYAHMNEIQDIIGKEKQMHIQLTETNFEGMISEAEAILKNVNKNVFIKVPTDFVGIKVIKYLKSKNINVTATAIYDYLQAILAIEAGADYIAPYVNRIGNIGSDPIDMIFELQNKIKEEGSHCKILAASFHSLSQIAEALKAGAEAITVQPQLIEQIFSNPSIVKAVEQFRNDWYSIYDSNLTKM